jgi:dephospho-CoA kinase
MKIIGLTGSIASGKSTIAQMFRDYGLAVHDADKTVHQLMSANGKATPLVLAAFGQHMSACDGSIDRLALGRKVFSDPEARVLLEAILHPLVYQARNKFFANLHRARKSLAVLDVPLLFETGGDAQCDYLVTVWAPQRLLRQRAMQRAHMTDEKFTVIINAQLPQSEKIRLSDLALPTGLGHAESRRRLKKWIKKIKF